MLDTLEYFSVSIVSVGRGESSWQRATRGSSGDPSRGRRKGKARPFWANYIQTEEKIYHGFVNLIGKVERDPDDAGNFLSRFLARYQPVSRLQYRESERFDNSPWVDKAVRSEGVKTFFWFARFPVARYREGDNGNHRVEFFDLRFGLMNDYKRFRYVVDFNRHGNVVFEGFL